MKFHGGAGADPVFEHRDLAAMILAIETLSESAASILSQIPERNRVAGPQLNNAPAQFLDRPPNGWSPDDHQIRYIVDDWGIPLGYMAQRDWKASPPPTDPNTPSKNHTNWNQTSTDLVRINGGAPVIFSWGPDGKEQLTQDAMGANASASIVGDWVNDPRDNGTPALNHPMNADNVYANQSLKEKLQPGSQQ
jgi:hypothetical protein